MKSFLITFLLATSLGLCSTVAAFAVEAADESKLAGIIENAKILGKGYRVRVTFSGPDVSVSTFRATESANTDNDCKITAALIAKELMINHDFGFRKARIYFHEPTMVGLFREVAVSYAELQALESGAVKQSDFMESLSVTKMPEKSDTAGGANSSANSTPSGSTASPGSSAAGSSDSGAGGTDRTTGSEAGPTATGSTGEPGANASTPANGSSGKALPTSTAPPPKKPETVRLYTSKKGSRFAIPEGWIVEDNFPHDRSLLFKLLSQVNGERNIEFSFDGSSGKTPAQCALEQRQKFAYSGVKVERYEQVKFGAGKYPGALIVLTYPNWDDEGKRYYEMHLYFGQNGGIYDMWGWCVFSKFKIVDQAFQKVMATMEFPTAKGATAKNAAAKSATAAKSAASATAAKSAAKTSPAKKK